MGKREEKWREQVALERKRLFRSRRTGHMGYIGTKERNEIAKKYLENRENLNNDPRRGASYAD